MFASKAEWECHGPIRRQETWTQSAQQQWQWSGKCQNMWQRGKLDKEETHKQTGQSSMSALTTNEKQAVRGAHWGAHTGQQPDGDQSYDGNAWMPIVWLGFSLCILLLRENEKWFPARMVMVKMYLADHRRGPVGDYQGLASFNLAPPPHQASRVPFYCCTAIYDTAMCILYSSATSITVAKIKLKRKHILPKRLLFFLAFIIQIL